MKIKTKPEKTLPRKMVDTAILAVVGVVVTTAAQKLVIYLDESGKLPGPKLGDRKIAL
jgi:hypothetical protein